MVFTVFAGPARGSPVRLDVLSLARDDLIAGCCEGDEFSENAFRDAG